MSHPRGTEKHLFAGGNTSLGFYSFYDQIAPVDSRRIMVIKGGPGVGKSTLMRQIGASLQDQGYAIEYFHCSSDNNSLDGIRAPELEIAMIDGTAPHIVDPKNPGAVDEILNLGEYWDETAIRSHKAEVLSVNATVGRTFQRAYRFLAAARSIYDNIEAANQLSLDIGRANETAVSVIQSIFGHRPVTSTVGKARHLFVSALTPNGPQNFLENLLQPAERRFVLLGSPGTGRSTLVKKVVDTAVERGFYVEAYHCAFDPLKIEHAYIPALRTVIITSAPPHTLDVDNAVTINMDQLRQHAVVVANQEKVAEDMELFWSLLSKATNTLAAAKQLHDHLEEYYIPNMNFHGIEAVRDQVLERIQTYAAEAAPPLRKM